MDEKIECPECEGEGLIYIDTSRQCGKSMSNCCGSCGYDVTCDNCSGDGSIEVESVSLQIDGYPNYTISNYGKVYSLKSGKLLKPQKDSKGYLRVSLYNCNGRKVFKIHKLVAIEFLEHTPCGMNEIIDHIDEDKTNNFVGNLRLTNNRDNVSKSYKCRSTSSGYTGVHKNVSGKKWISQIVIDGKTKHLGTFNNEIEASNAYNLAKDLI